MGGDLVASQVCRLSDGNPSACGGYEHLTDLIANFIPEIPPRGEGISENLTKPVIPPRRAGILCHSTGTCTRYGNPSAWGGNFFS